MPLVPALCTQCGSRLEIDSSQEATICPFCKTPFVTETAVNNYNTSNVTNIEHLHADVVSVNDELSLENRIKAGNTFLKLGEYTEAKSVFGELSQDFPYDYRCWIGLIKIDSKMFTNFDVSRTELNEMLELYKKAKIVSSVQEAESEFLKCDKYFEKCFDILKKLKAETDKKISLLNTEYERNSTPVEAEINSLEMTKLEMKNPLALATGISLAIGIIFGFVFAAHIEPIRGDCTGFIAASILVVPLCTGIAWLIGSIFGSALEKNITENNEI